MMNKSAPWLPVLKGSTGRQSCPYALCRQSASWLSAINEFALLSQVSTLCRQSAQFGVSLIELIITVSIIAVMLTTSLASFGGMINEQNTQSAVQQISYAVKKSKYYAKTQGIPTKISFTENSNTYLIEADSVLLTSNTNFDATSGELPENMRIIYSSCGELFFQPDGSILDSYGNHMSSACQVAVGADYQSSARLYIQPQTGTVTYD
jgi:prepilin-type N-terminal cleavage/methylation domain-containing protein